MVRVLVLAAVAVALFGLVPAPVSAASLPCAGSGIALAGKSACPSSNGRPRAVAWRPHVLKLFGRPFRRAKCKG